MNTLDPCTFVLFGATGDLARRKLAPALYALHREKMLPEKFVILAYARRDKNDDVFREDLKAAIQEFAPKMPTDGDEWDSFAKRCFYQRGDFDKPEGFHALADRLKQIDNDRGGACNHLFYLAIPPEQYEMVAEHLGEAKLSRPEPGCAQWTRIIIEKPFGYDLPTSHHLNETLLANFDESQIYRIDHYLGKETVQNILVFRFANQLFEPLWNHKYVDHVQITVAEKIGVEGRGDYFDGAGMSRDVLQNHALQILSLTAMEAPVSLGADAIRDEKVKALKSIRPIHKEDVSKLTVRGQYEGYKNEKGVKPDSTTETYVAVCINVDNLRWGGVPFYIRAAKGMPSRMTEVAVQFKSVPQVLFAATDCEHSQPNVLVMRIQPDEGIHLFVGAKEPGTELHLKPVDLHFTYKEAFPEAPIADAYERLLLDAVRGDASLFARGDEVEVAWSLLTPVLAEWKEQPNELHSYAMGTWGPEQANTLFTSEGGWRNL